MKRICLALVLLGASPLNAAETDTRPETPATAAVSQPQPRPDAQSRAATAPIVTPSASAATPEQAPISPAKTETLAAKLGSRLKKFLHQVGVQPLLALQSILLSPAFWIALAITVTLERLIPAEPNRKIFSQNFAHDVAWFCYEPFLHALIVGTYVALWAKLQKVYFPDLYFPGLSTAPEWMRFTLALLLLDLGYWLQHYINHRVPWLWRLHSVHHSQQQLNFFTDFRYHPLEYVIRHSFIAVPFLFLRIDPPLIAGFAVVKEWYSRFYHGNIRTNLGPLKYILVTPQSHRIHHSLESAHYNTNYGATFSFWDTLFGTRYKGYEEYPATGLMEPEFPHEEKATVPSLLLTPWRQMRHGLRRSPPALQETARSRRTVPADPFPQP